MLQPEAQRLDLIQEANASHGLPQRDHPHGISRSLSSIRRLRSDESWIEVSSQPSSSSLSSATPEDANAAALGVQFDQHGRRRRRLLRTGQESPLRIAARRSSLTGGSSQEEYEESESESDRVMTSSNENIGRTSSDEPSPQSMPSLVSRRLSDGEEDDDDENATALGVASNAPVFMPPPNAFSHPRHGQQQSSQHHTRTLESHASYFPPQRPSPLRAQSTQSYPNRGQSRTHNSYNLVSSNYQTDHDAALRASLSTLLSCAAAARGLPKHDGTQRQSRVQSNHIESSGLRLVPESALPRPTSPIEEIPMTTEPITSQAPRLPPRNRSPSEKTKRKTSPFAKEQGNSGRSKKKPRASSPRPRRANSPGVAASSNNEIIHPTLMTWVVSAGVIIICSAISFSAGYVIGREVGMVEAGNLVREDGAVCSREVGKSLKRLRWGSGTGGLSMISA